MTNVLPQPNPDHYPDPEAYRVIQAIHGLLTGQTDWGTAISHTSFEDDGIFADTIRNLGTGGHINVQRSTDGASLFNVIDLGVNTAALSATSVEIGTTLEVGTTSLFGGVATFEAAVIMETTLDVTGAVTFGSTLDVTDVATFEAAVEIGDTLDVAGAATFEDDVLVEGAATVQGDFLAEAATTLGTSAGDAITVVGTATFEQLATFDLAVVIGNTAVSNDEVLRATGGSLLEGLVFVSSDVGVPVAGSGLELYFVGGVGTLDVFDRGGSAYLPLKISGLTVEIQDSGNTRIEVDSNGIGFFGETPVARPSVTGTLSGADLGELTDVVESLIDALAAGELGLITNDTS